MDGSPFNSRNGKTKDGTSPFRSPFTTLRNFASLGNRGALSPISKGSPAEVGESKEEVKQVEQAKDKENYKPENANDGTDCETSLQNEFFKTTSDSLSFNPDKNEDKQDKDGDKYFAIASLDEEHDDEKWLERTTVITKTDHETYLECAESIIKEVLTEVKTPDKGNDTFEIQPPDSGQTSFSEMQRTDSGQTSFASPDTSFSINFREESEDSSTEYESATEAEESFTVP